MKLQLIHFKFITIIMALSEGRGRGDNAVRWRGQRGGGDWPVFVKDTFIL